MEESTNQLNAWGMETKSWEVSVKTVSPANITDVLSYLVIIVGGVPLPLLGPNGAPQHSALLGLLSSPTSPTSWVQNPLTRQGLTV